MLLNTCTWIKEPGMYTHKREWANWHDDLGSCYQFLPVVLLELLASECLLRLMRSTRYLSCRCMWEKQQNANLVCLAHLELRQNIDCSVVCLFKVDGYSLQVGLLVWCANIRRLHTCASNKNVWHLAYPRMCFAYMDLCFDLLHT